MRVTKTYRIEIEHCNHSGDDLTSIVTYRFGDDLYEIENWAELKGKKGLKQFIDALTEILNDNK